MKKLNIYGVMLTVSFFLASFFIVVFVNQHIMNKTNNRNYNMFIGHDAAKAMIVCDSPFIISPADLGSDFVIYGMLTSDETYESNWVRTVYGNGSFPSPSVKDGRFFTADELLSKEPLCVLGSAAEEKSSETVNGEEYFSFEGVKYRVVGHIGTDAASDLDVIVMLNWGGYFNNKTKLSGTFIIDSDSSAAVNTAFENLRNSAEEADGVMFYKMVYNSTIRSFDTYSRILYPFALAILILSIVIISYFYIDSLSYRFAVKKLVGFSLSDLFFEIVTGFAAFALCGISAAFICIKLLSFNETYSSSELGYFTVLTPQTVIYAAIASVILAVILSLAPVVFAYRLDTGEQLK